MNHEMYVWQMVKEAIQALGGDTTNGEVREWILRRFPETNKNTINCQIIVCTVNHDSRIHYPENNKPRIADSKYDFLFRSGRGLLESYDSQKHGQWEIYTKDDSKLGVRKTDEEFFELENLKKAEEGTAFAAESHLRDYLAQNLHRIEEDLELYVDEDGRDGVEYPTGVGFIDILAVDAQGEFVVVELKVSRGPDSVAGQILRYKNWVKNHLAKGEPTRGVIVAQFISDKIRYAIASDPEISAKEYEISLSLKDVEDVR